MTARYRGDQTLIVRLTIDSEADLERSLKQGPRNEFVAFRTPNVHDKHGSLRPTVVSILCQEGWLLSLRTLMSASRSQLWPIETRNSS
ncbi:uncharacterized protein BT62DRAFT_740307 [Guyanagaster necrorhizus]|uniref:Uncharacterized protein n=1 Tax=Guyanagaster necrorhizus TaxID=856835 RepID=A0A9P7VF10_9AGAR|nr:uncharacterized protein BT62DRAFT_740307 [Guyanagaster necrorhizus MCA 3950]KAG7439345.1 hypothetical protein BT62DRAFT_740307 [Guyanagaster necrorhizus MCA 3950]